MLNKRYLDALEIYKRREVPDDPLQLAVCKYLEMEERNVEIPFTPVFRAIEVYRKGKQSKVMMEASLLARDTTPAGIAESLELKEETVTAYRDLFFDTTKLRDALDMTDYLGSLREDGSNVSTAEYISKVDAYRNGFYTVIDNIKCDGFSRDPRRALLGMLNIADSMIRQGQGACVTADAAREARGWMSSNAKILEALLEYDKTTKGDGNRRDEFRQMLLEPKQDVYDMKEIEGKYI